jgi:hypothetical protein
MVRYKAMVKKGYAIPSLAADSAEIIWRSWAETFSIANLPSMLREISRRLSRPLKHIPTMVAQIIGSVGVKQADMARQETKLRLGKSNFRIPD